MATREWSYCPARAGDRDGLYGRFDGDLELGVAAGGALTDGGPALAAQVTVTR